MLGGVHAAFSESSEPSGFSGSSESSEFSEPAEPSESSGQRRVGQQVTNCKLLVV